MSIITKSAFDTLIDSTINTNGVKSITGQELNTVLHHIADTLLWAEQRRDRAVALTTAANPNEVTFKDVSGASSAFGAGTLVLIAGVRCYDASGNNVDFNITDVAVGGFSISVAANCSMDYVATAKGTI